MFSFLALHFLGVNHRSMNVRHQFHAVRCRFLWPVGGSTGEFRVVSHKHAETNISSEIQPIVFPDTIIHQALLNEGPLGLPLSPHSINTQWCFVGSSQVHILGVGLAVHEKLVHPEMRPLHKKLIDQFQMMRSSLCHVSAPKHSHKRSVCSAFEFFNLQSSSQKIKCKTYTKK